MPLRGRHQASKMPEIDMIPMLGVMLVVLAFFVFVTMTLRSQQGTNLTLPSAKTGAAEVEAAEPLVVALNLQNQISVDGKVVTPEELSTPLVTYLNKNPKGTIVLKADRQLSYKKVLPLLETLKAIGGDRVSLAIAN